MATNIKKLLLPQTLARAGWALIESREDVAGVPYEVGMPVPQFHELLEDAAGVALSVTPFGDPELDAGPRLEVVARIGVGYDAVDVAALTRRKIPLMIAGTANSVSVAEAGIYLMMSLARRGAAMDAMARGALARPLSRDAGRSVRQDSPDRRLRQDRHARGQAARCDGNACPRL